MRGPFRSRCAKLSCSGSQVLGLHGTPYSPAGPSEGLIRCPQPDHEDLHPSCSVNLASGQFYCFSCGRFGDRVDLHRLLGGFRSGAESLEDLERLQGAKFPEPLRSPFQPSRRRSQARKQEGRPFIAKRWRYREADLTPAFDVIRREYRLPCGRLEIDEKSGKPAKTYQPTPPGGSWAKLPEPYRSGRLRPLLYLAEILDASRNEVIWVVEGETAADALRFTGRIATTSSSGSSSARKTNWEPLAGRRVVIWPDNDEAGIKYAEDVADQLRRLSPRPRIRVLKNIPKALPRGGDAVDWARRRTTTQTSQLLSPHRGGRRTETGVNNR